MATARHNQSKLRGKHPKIQLLTIEERLSGKKIDMPPIRQAGATNKKAEKFTPGGVEQLKIREDN